MKTISVSIRRCAGNRSAWGAFINNANDWCLGTALSLDGLASMLESRYPEKKYRDTWKIRIELFTG